MLYVPEPIGQGKAKAKVFLEENPDIAAEIEAKLRQRLFDTDDEADALEDVVVDVSEDELLATAVSPDSEIDGEDREPVEEDK